MNTVKYNKLIRDKIPEIIEASGKSCSVQVLSDADYITYLDKKLEEELAEYQADKSMEELADLLEVVYSVSEAKGCSVEQLESIRLEKAEKRGRFTKKLCLKEVSSHAETVE